MHGDAVAGVCTRFVHWQFLTSVSFRVPETPLNVKVANFKVSLCLGDERLEEA